MKIFVLMTTSTYETKYVWGGFFFFFFLTLTSSSLSAGCLTIQFNSDTNYPELALDPTG